MGVAPWQADRAALRCDIDSLVGYDQMVLHCYFG